MLVHREWPHKIVLSDEDHRALVYLLDRLCEHEESVIECATLDGEITRDDEISARAVMQSRRVWKRANRIMHALEGALEPEKAYAHPA